MTKKTVAFPKVPEVPRWPLVGEKRPCRDVQPPLVQPSWAQGNRFGVVEDGVWVARARRDGSPSALDRTPRRESARRTPQRPGGKMQDDAGADDAPAAKRAHKGAECSAVETDGMMIAEDAVAGEVAVAEGAVVNTPC